MHRDVKPANILFDAEGTPRLADLGVAKVQDGEHSSTDITMSNVMVGSPAYMAPEQMLDAHGADMRADIFSLGIVLWELLVGKCPNAGASTVELMARALRSERIPDIRLYRKNLATGIVTLVRRMTDPDVTRRFATAEEVVRFIDEWREWEKRRLRLWLIGSISVGIMLVLAVLAGGVWHISKSAKARKVDVLDVEIRTAKAPKMDALLARAEAKAREGEALPPAAKIQNASGTNQVQTASVSNATQIVSGTDATQSVSRADAVTAVRPKTLPPKHKTPDIEELAALFVSLASDATGEGMRQIDAAVNAARRIDPDLSMLAFDGSMREGAVRALSNKEIDVCLKGMVFLRLEILRRQKGRMPTAAEIRQTCDKIRTK